MTLHIDLSDSAIEGTIESAIDRVRRRWVEDVGDPHDAWDTTDLTKSVLESLKKLETA